MHCHSSRRQFLTTAIACGGALLPGPATLSAAPREDRSRAVLAHTIGVDMHNHVYPAGTEPHRGPQPAAPPMQTPELSLADELRQSGLTAVCAAYVLDFAHIEKPGDARERFLSWLTAIDAQLRKGRVRRALNLKDLESAHRFRQPAIVQSVEGAQFIEGHLDRVEEVYKRGVRHLQLLHEQDDLVAPLGDVNTGAAHLGGLTPLGADVIRECNRLGILVDLAHASHETVLAALKVATRPVIISHTNLDTFAGPDPKMHQMMMPRLISRDHAKVVADAGGVIGVWTHLAPSLPEFVQSIKAMVDAVGVDHTGIGSDTDLLSSRVGQGSNRAWPGLNGGFFNAVVAEMLRQGFTPADITKIGGGNFCRVFGKATA